MTKVIKATGNEDLIEGAADLVKKGTGGDATFTWFPVNLTWLDWMSKVGGGEQNWENCPTHSGTLLRTERGVFGCGLIGSFFAGSKRPDGSIDRSGATLNGPMKDGEIILEYADPDYGKHGCHRDATTGAIVCRCPG
jgi:hypothetical protein